MNRVVKKPWEKMRTAAFKHVENVLREKFEQVDAYRYNTASIRVRVIDSRFEGKSFDKRIRMTEPFIAKLPAEIQGDIMNVVALSPDQASESLRAGVANLEFEEPSPSIL